MAIMVGNGAQAGALSPFAPTGIIVTGLMDKIGLGGHEWRTYWTNLVAHAIVAFAGYFLFGGWRLFKHRVRRATRARQPSDDRVRPRALDHARRRSRAC